MPIIHQNRLADFSGPIIDHLLIGQTATGSGKKVRTDGLRPLSLTIRNVTGTGTFTVQIFASNEGTEPIDDNHPILANVTANQAVTFTESFKWIWARLNAVTGGASLTVAMLAG